MRLGATMFVTDRGCEREPVTTMSSPKRGVSGSSAAASPSVAGCVASLAAGSSWASMSDGTVANGKRNAKTTTGHRGLLDLMTAPC